MVKLITNKRIPVYFFIGYVFFLATLSMCKTFGFFRQDIMFFQQLFGGDKSVHFIVSSVLGFSAFLLINVHTEKLLKKGFLLFLCVLFLISLDELLQLFFVTRVFELEDLYYGWVGVLLGSLVGVFAKYIELKKMTTIKDK